MKNLSETQKLIAIAESRLEKIFDQYHQEKRISRTAAAKTIKKAIELRKTIDLLETLK